MFGHPEVGLVCIAEGERVADGFTHDVGRLQVPTVVTNSSPLPLHVQEDVAGPLQLPARQPHRPLRQVPPVVVVVGIVGPGGHPGGAQGDQEEEREEETMEKLMEKCGGGSPCGLGIRSIPRPPPPGGWSSP